MKHFDVIIVGARIAGASLAAKLSRQRLKVALVDKAKFPSDTLSTHFVNPRGMSYLKNLGLLDEIKKHVPTSEVLDIDFNGISVGAGIELEVLQNRLRKVHGRSLEISSEFACIRRSYLDQLLVEKAQEEGAELILGHSLTGLDFSGSRQRAKLAGPDGREVILSANQIVGADGRQSKTAELLGLGTLEYREVSTFATYAYIDGFKGPVHRMSKRNRIAMGAASTNNGQTMILVYGPSHFYDEFRKNKTHNFFRALKYIDPTFADRFRQAVPANRQQELRLQSAVNLPSFLRQHSPLVPLIGDAACFKDQCTASGMTHALRDSTLLADHLLRAFRGQDSFEKALDDFETSRYQDSLRFFDFTAQQAEMNPPSTDDLEFYQAISRSAPDRQAFVGLYCDIVDPKDFFSKTRRQRLQNTAAPKAYGQTQLQDLYGNIFAESLLPTTAHPQPDLASFSRSTNDFSSLSETNFAERSKNYGDFVSDRLNSNTFQYERTLTKRPATHTELVDARSRSVSGLNLASQDYLGLAQSASIREAALKALRDFGPHSSGSPMVIGNTKTSRDLEHEVKKLTGKEHILLYPTGYAAGLGAVLGLVRPHDHIVMDRLTHACLQQGAHAATAKIHRFSHLSVDAARYVLRGIRDKDKRGAILLITEGIFSMDADAPDLKRFQEIANEYNATLLVDVAHDLGASGPAGRGQLGIQNFYGQADLVMGSFSKTFATNGGFVASNSADIISYLKMYSTPFMFSNALSPLSAAIALESARIVQNSNGEELRRNLLRTVTFLRDGLKKEGLRVLGLPCAIVPVLIGTEEQARRAHKITCKKNLAAMILEYPVVPIGSTRFRLQLMSTHTQADAVLAVKLLSEVMKEVRSDNKTRPLLRKAG